MQARGSDSQLSVFYRCEQTLAVGSKEARTSYDAANCRDLLRPSVVGWPFLYCFNTIVGGGELRQSSYVNRPYLINPPDVLLKANHSFLTMNKFVGKQRITHFLLMLSYVV